MALIDCLKRIGLSEYESEILMGQANLAMRNGAKENEAALQAINEYRASLDVELNDIVSQVDVTDKQKQEKLSYQQIDITDQEQAETKSGKLAIQANEIALRILNKHNLPKEVLQGIYSVGSTATKTRRPGRSDIDILIKTDPSVLGDVNNIDLVNAEEEIELELSRIKGADWFVSTEFDNDKYLKLSQSLPSDIVNKFNGENNTYPLADINEWYGDANFQNENGTILSMTPDEYIDQVKSIDPDEELTRENIDDLKQHIKDGNTIDPLVIYSDGKEDGRHRAYAAKELGIEEVPVIMFNPDDANILNKSTVQLKITDEQRADFMNHDKWHDKGLKISKKTKLYRGISDTTGEHGASYGYGLYVTTDKKQAKEFGEVIEMDHDSLPSNPLRFATESDFSNWISHIYRSLNFKRISELEKVVGSNDKLIKIIDPTIDGVQIGTGKGAFFVKFSNESVLNQTAPTFYSQLNKVVQDSQQAKATPEQWNALFKKNGVKQEEIEWLDIKSFMEGKKTLTKDELIDFIQANQVEVQEVFKSEKNKVSLTGNNVEIFDTREEAEKRIEEEIEWIDNESVFVGVENDYIEVVDSEGNEIFRADLKDGVWIRTDEQYEEEQYENVEEAIAEAESHAEKQRDMWREEMSEQIEEAETTTSTKFQSYQLPGGENYRELLLTLPTPTSENVARRAELAAVDRERPLTTEEQSEFDSLRNLTAGPDTYKSPHYDEPNILAHIRFNERTDADGKRVLFIEEIQSDFGQTTRKVKQNIKESVENDFQSIVDSMKDAGVLEINCD